MKLNRLDDALRDIEMCISLDNVKGLGYVVKGDCLRLKHNYKEAFECYDKALDDNKSNHF